MRFVFTESSNKWARYIGEHEGNVLGLDFREDGGQGGQLVIGSDSNVRDSAIGEDENGSDGVDMLLDLRCNTLLVELLLPKNASVGQARCVEDANLGKRLGLLTATRHTGTYHYTVLALKFVKVDRVGLALVIRTMLFVGVVEGFEVIVVDVVALKGIGDEVKE